MARADTHTLIPLDSAARVIGIDPLHFNSIVTSARTDHIAQDDMWYQHNWQDIGRISREDFAFALNLAEFETATNLGYWPLPQWIEEEEHPMNYPNPTEYMWAAPINSRFQKQSVQTKWGHVTAFGQRATSVIEADSAVTLSDPDGDGYKELATVSVATTITDVEEIRVFYPGKSADRTWEIRPVDVSISAGVATITFPSYLIPLESLIEIFNSSDDKINIDGEVDANFLTTVDVYRVYTDPSTQLTFYYPSTCDCGTDSCASCQESSESGCLSARNQRLGFLRFSRADWDSDNEQFIPKSFTYSYLPERMKIWYRAGLKNTKSDYPHLQMDNAWMRLIVYYALTKLDNELSAGENVKRVFMYQTKDMAISTDNENRSISPGMIDNPLGTTRAAINLWRMIQRHRIFEG